jgi:hypothetical protein
LTQAHDAVHWSDAPENRLFVTGISNDELGIRQTLSVRSRSRNIDEGLTDVDPRHPESSAREFEAVSPRSTTDVKDRRRRREPEFIDQEIDFLNRSLGERVTQVSLTHVVGKFLEPVVWFRHVELRLG